PSCRDRTSQADPAEPGVTQTPRYRIANRGEKLTLDCAQDLDNEVMYWYRQDPGQGLQLLHYSVNVNIMEKGDLPDGYQVSREKKGRFPLTLESAVPNQTALYLCASSFATALRGQLLPVHKGRREAR
uniref:Ig-like domain-containing protein n=1 Tax=Loxodonta africana TaxID=9785 RepID=G3UE03_LOXAF